MGMYTELVLSTRIKNDPEVVEVLKCMCGLSEQPATLPDHPLFACHRWRMLFTCSSYYFVPRSMQLFEFDNIGQCWVLITRADLKNYDDEIEKFLDWINPHLDVEVDEMIGYSRYEETREPTIHYARP